MRTREDNEVVPKSAQLSKQIEEEKTAENAFDLDLQTKARAERNSDGEIWLKVSLGRVYCVEHVIEYNKVDINTQFKWICSSAD